MECLFCKTNGHFCTQEHIIPESLGNDDLILKGHICDACQNYLGKEVEAYVLNKTSFALWRTILGIRTKKGKLPRVNLSQPKVAKGRLPDKHAYHDDGVAFVANPDGSHAFEVTSEQMRTEILTGSRSAFNFVVTPKTLCMIGRLLGKIGLELMCLVDANDAKMARYDDIRTYVRRGTSLHIWPLFHYSEGRIEDLAWLKPAIRGAEEEIQCYSYSLRKVDGIIAKQYTLLRFTIGTDNWVICLNDRYPHPIIREHFGGNDLKLMWYSPRELDS